jgi:hypothetical protein
MLNVFLKHPHGVIFDLGEGKTLTLNGYHTAGAEVVADFAITRNVADDVWDAVVKQQGDSILFKAGFVIAKPANQSEKAENEAKAVTKKLKSGFEPLQPEEATEVTPE